VLVFTRKRDEAIVIGDGIEVRILRVGRDGVRLGVVAPASVAVHRREVYDQIRRENEAAAAATAGARALASRLRSAGHQGAAAEATTPMAATRNHLSPGREER
jgi:carbon storage regulator